MKPLIEITSQYRSMYAASKDLNISAVQLKRLIDKGAVVNSEGVIYIPSANSINITI